MLKNKLSLVIPIYNEENINTAIERIRNVLNNADIIHEIILVDDGSTNNCAYEIASLANIYKNVIGIFLSRNFGKENALCAGLDFATGDCVVCMDSDMQHPPEVIPQMYKLWLEGYEVVEGIKNEKRKEKFIYKISEKTFYSLLKRFGHINLKNSSDFRLLDKKALDAWKCMSERQVYFRGMSSWIGFKRTQIYFDVEDRQVGKSKWSTLSLIKLAITGLTSYSVFPLYISTFCGAIFLLFFVAMFIQTLYMKIRGLSQSGFTTVIILQLIIGSILMIGIGIIGIYIEKIYEEVKARPRYIVCKVIRGEETTNEKE